MPRAVPSCSSEVRPLYQLCGAKSIRIESWVLQWRFKARDGMEGSRIESWVPRDHKRSNLAWSLDVDNQDQTKAISQINVVVRGPRTHTAPSSLVLMVRAPCEKQHGTHKTVWGMYSWGGVPLPNGSPPGSPANSLGGGILRIEWLCRSPLLSWPCSACSACLSKMICPDQRSACQGVYDHGERGAGCKPKVAEHVGCLDVFALFKCKSGATNGFVWKWSTPKGSQKSKIHGLSMFIIIGGNPKFWNKTKCVFALCVMVLSFATSIDESFARS